MENAFGGLALQFGFVRVHESTRQVDYCSSSVHPRFEWDAGRSSELDITFELSKSDAVSSEPPFSLWEFLSMVDPPAAKQLAWKTVATLDALPSALCGMVDAIREDGVGILSGAPHLHERLRNWRAAHAKEVWGKELTRRANEDALSAWDRKNWAGVIVALSSIDSTLLTPSARKRLGIARERLSGSPDSLDGRP